MSRGPYPILLMLAMSLPSAVRALGLGDIRIDSELNEPLSAQIDIVGATRDELAALTASVANREIFQRYGADRPAFLSSATFKVGMDAQGHPVLNVRSGDAFTDPLVSFLVDLRWGKNEIVREYSLLLDPPGYKYPGQASGAALASTGVSPARGVALPTAHATQTGVAVIAAPAPSAEPPTTLAGGSSVRVAAGDTLRGVARRAGAQSESQAQRLMIAIFRANPSAFDGNINRLHRGAVLTIPAAAELAALSDTDAHREFRAQMTAWHQDGRSSAVNGFAANSSTPTTPGAPVTPTAAIDATASAAASTRPAKTPESPDALLKDRVQTLEQALDDLHKQLASENAKIQDLKQLAAQTSTAATKVPAAGAPVAPPAFAAQAPATAAPAPTLAHPAGTVVAAAAATAAPSLTQLSQPARTAVAQTPTVIAQGPAVAAQPSTAATQATAVAAKASSVAAPASTVTAPTAARSAELVQTPIVAAAHSMKTPTATNANPASASANNAEFLGPVAVTLGLLIAGFAYVRKRLTNAPAQPNMAEPDLAETMETEILEIPASPVAAARAAPKEASKAAESFNPAAAAAIIEPLQRTDFPVVAAPERTTELTSAEITANLEIDIEALERSYLDSQQADDAAADTTTLETVGIGTHDLDMELINADLSTAVMEPKKVVPASATAETALDFDLLDLDFTTQHVQLPSGMNDHPVMSERRTAIVDVLKTAIERDPNRSDLRMKLLETYYGAASTNQRAFMEVARELSREQDTLSADDWKKVVMMGRQIAPDDILFADLPKDDADLANCA